MYEVAAYLFLVSLLASNVLTPLSIRLGRRWSVLDLPGPRKVHSQPIPLSGGWALFASLTLVVWGHLGVALLVRGTSVEDHLPDIIRNSVELAPRLVLKILPIYGGALALFVIGLVDDLWGLAVRHRLRWQLLIATGLALLGVRPSADFLSPWVAGVIGVIWIVGITNAFNFLDGLDGLSTGVAMVATLALLTIMGETSQPDVAYFLAALAGGQLGFLRYNFHPARIFLGSSGSLLLGYLLGVSTVLATYLRNTQSNWLMPLLSPLFLLAIPIYDTTSVVLIRLIQKRPISIGDQSHFHHRLMRLGFSHLQTVVFIVAIAFAVALSGIRLVDSTFRQSLVILVQITAIFSIVILAERVAWQARQKIIDRRRRATDEPSAVLHDNETKSSR
jgi:UDP-GlcNAc:undecaprenyl-phosphate GlcNAc-1-phosphate transferase